MAGELPEYPENSKTDKLELADTSTDPSSNGEVRNNGGTIKAQSNGTVTDILNRTAATPTYVVRLNGSTVEVVDTSGSVVDTADNSSNNAQNSLQYAVDNTSSYERIYIQDGTYNCSGAVTLSGEPAKIYISGSKGAVLRDESGITQLFDISDGGGEQTVQDIVIDGITLDGQDSGGTIGLTQAIKMQNARNVWIKNCEIRNFTSYGILASFGECKYIRFSGNEIWRENPTNAEVVFGIYLNNYKHENISSWGNYIHDIGANGIQHSGGTENFTCYGNLMRNLGHSAITASPASRGIIANNVIEYENGSYTWDDEEAGIETEFKHVSKSSGDDWSETSHHITVANNTIKCGNDLGYGILVHNRPPSNWTQGTNDIADPHHITIAGNNVYNAEKYNIYLAAGGRQIRLANNNTVSAGTSELQVDSRVLNVIRNGQALDVADPSASADVDSNATGTRSAYNELVDSGQSWTTDEWAGYVVRIDAGTGSGQERKIKSNTSTVLTTEWDWETKPDDTSDYIIEPRYRDASGYYNGLTVYDGTNQHDRVDLRGTSSWV